MPVKRLRARSAHVQPAIPARPRLLPRTRWGKAALLLLLVATLCRSLIFASSQPTLLGADEDYHFHYVNHLVIEHSLPTISGDFATAELFAMAELTQLGAFLQGPVGAFEGRPHSVVKRLDELPGAYLQPTAPGTRNVLHAPGYHVGAALVDRAVIHDSPVTRLTLMRYYSAVLGAIGVFFAWLLAAQLLARTWQQLAAAALVAFQPIAAFSSSTMTNDVLVLLGMTATLAWCAFLLRTPPRAAQGVGLGLMLTVGLYSKSTALALVPIVGFALLLLLAANRDRWRAVLKIGAWGFGLPLLLVGWWYVYARVQSGSFLGGSAAVGDTLASRSAHGIGFVPTAIGDWFSNVYPGYWFQYLAYEVTQRDLWYYLPLGLGLVGAVGLVVRIVELRHRLLDRTDGELRQILVLLSAPLILLGPPLFVDVVRQLKGLPYAENQARFLVPAFPAVAVLMMIGFRQLTARIRYGLPVLAGVLVAVAAVFYWRNYVTWSLERFYGSIGDLGLDEVLRNAGWLKPEWVGPAWFITLFAIAVVATLGALGCAVVDARRPQSR